MAEAVTTIPESRDPLAETLQLLRLTGTLYCQSELTAPWSIDLPPLEDCMMFHIVTSGHCYLQLEDEEPLLLEQGSLALIPHGQGHHSFSSAEVEAVPLFDLPIQQVSERYETLHHGGGGARTQLTCGVVRFDHVAAAQLIAQLPKVMKVHAWEDEGDGWLHSTMRFLTREAKELRPGSETVMTRLADILIIQMIRAWIAKAPEQERGWFAALRDRQIGQALMAIHDAPADAWTLESLAKRASMSRSAFAARFTDLVGEPAMKYLTRWRMQLARTHLREGTATLTSLAQLCGYRSEPAFRRAFKRMYGVAPGAMRDR
ncbi:MAG: AraC family transcriptional regulator [Planctomycetota bacterium]